MFEYTWVDTHFKGPTQTHSGETITKQIIVYCESQCSCVWVWHDINQFHLISRSCSCFESITMLTRNTITMNNWINQITLEEDEQRYLPVCLLYSFHLFYSSAWKAEEVLEICDNNITGCKVNYKFIFLSFNCKVSAKVVSPYPLVEL